MTTNDDWESIGPALLCAIKALKADIPVYGSPISDATWKLTKKAISRADKFIKHNPTDSLSNSHARAEAAIEDLYAAGRRWESRARKAEHSLAQQTPPSAR